MSRTAAIAQPPSPKLPTVPANSQTRSDLSQFCLPGATRDETQKLAYVDSLCIFVLAVGFIGIKAPQLINRDPPAPEEVVPVEIVHIQPEHPPEPEPLKPDEEPPPETPDLPQIATLVAANPAQVSFAIPVEGPVIFAPNAFAQAPPAVPPKAAPPKPTRFTPSKGDGGSYPQPNYPRQALEQRLTGVVELWIKVDEAGSPVSVEIKKTSGFGVLDRHAQSWIKEKWRFPPGQIREYWYEWTYQLK